MEKLLMNILRVKNEKKISDVKFQKDLGLYSSAVSEWKNGSSKSYIKHIIKISDYLGVSLDELRGVNKIGEQSFSNVEDVCKFLGDDYMILSINGANVVYRNLGNGYAIEISNPDTASDVFKMNLYVRKVTVKKEIIESIIDIYSLKCLLGVLKLILEKYLLNSKEKGQLTYLTANGLEMISLFNQLTLKEQDRIIGRLENIVETKRNEEPYE